MIEAFKAKVDALPKLRVAKLQIVAHMQLVDADGVVIEECTSQPLVMFPGKFLEMKEAIARIEEDSNKDEASITQLLNRKLW